ncbi:MAG: hypothetical protein Q7R70_00285 [Candidatus Diapherotrites archaeon]|nr:hypothetical protein [Candidatus Diapherotrites archaeon]
MVLKKKEGLTKPGVIERIKIWLWLATKKEEESQVGPKRKMRRQKKARKERQTSLKKVKKYKKGGLDVWK